ncbi:MULTISPECIES: hypothetical protein [unclassified Streptomyces]|uniref:hypothetical protein n=1 Tax=unclassified Streptomyces TaxID=2593676 RepID=UPI00382C6C5D
MNADQQQCEEDTAVDRRRGLIQRVAVICGLAGALMAVGPVAARADTGPVDAAVALESDRPQVAPGNTIDVVARVWMKTGSVKPLFFLVHLPKGLTFVPEEPETVGGGPPLCTAASADLREVKCHAAQPDYKFGEAGVRVRAAAGVPEETRLTITETADIGDAVDAHPQDNTASLTVLVKSGADWTPQWSKPTTSVQPGGQVTTRLSVTNHGREPDTMRVFLTSSPGHDQWLRRDGDNELANCLPGDDVGEWCDVQDTVAPGGTFTLTLRYAVAPEARGSTLRLSARVLSEHPGTEANLDDNTATLTLQVADKAEPSGTPTAHPTHAASGPGLAATGAAGTQSLLLAAAGAAATGGATLFLTNRRRRN